MDYNSEYTFFQPFLLPNEVLLWHGAPGPGRINTYGRIPVLFSIIWLGFSLLWEITAIMNGILIMVLFGLPFLLIGLSVAFGGSIKNARLKGKIFYAVTNQRLLIREGTDMKIFTADMLPPMAIRMNKTVPEVSFSSPATTPGETATSTNAYVLCKILQMWGRRKELCPPCFPVRKVSIAKRTLPPSLIPKDR